MNNLGGSDEVMIAVRDETRRRDRQKETGGDLNRRTKVYGSIKRREIDADHISRGASNKTRAN